MKTTGERSTCSSPGRWPRRRSKVPPQSWRPRGIQREYPGPWWARPIEADDSAPREVRCAAFQRLQQRRTSCLRYNRFTSEKNDTRPGLSRMREDLREIEIVRKNDIFMLSGESTDLRVGRRRIPGIRPMKCLVTGACQFVNPPGREVHVDQKTHQLARGNSRPCARFAAYASASRIS
jgi:hypothetical protein